MEQWKVDTEVFLLLFLVVVGTATLGGTNEAAGSTTVAGFGIGSSATATSNAGGTVRRSRWPEVAGLDGGSGRGARWWFRICFDS